MHLNTLAGRGYSDLTQYPVFPWILADYDSESLDLSDPKTFRKLHKPMGCQTPEGEEEFRKRFVLCIYNDRFPFNIRLTSMFCLLITCGFMIA